MQDDQRNKMTQQRHSPCQCDTEHPPHRQEMAAPSSTQHTSTPPNQTNKKWSRRGLLRLGFTGALAALLGLIFKRNHLAQAETVWQIDPSKCAACGRCATSCVLRESAVKCVHAYAMCGYCELCTGFFNASPEALNEGAENQLCPTGAIQRSYVEDPYFEYSIDEKLCIGCGLCVRGCQAFGNGSLFLQVRHDRCLNCNECTIALVCPTDAFVRVPASKPYLLKPMNKISDGPQHEVERIDQ